MGMSNGLFEDVMELIAEIFSSIGFAVLVMCVFGFILVALIVTTIVEVVRYPFRRRTDVQN